MILSKPMFTKSLLNVSAQTLSHIFHCSRANVKDVKSHRIPVFLHLTAGCVTWDKSLDCS